MNGEFTYFLSSAGGRNHNAVEVHYSDPELADPNGLSDAEAAVSETDPQSKGEHQL